MNKRKGPGGLSTEAYSCDSHAEEERDLNKIIDPHLSNEKTWREIF